MSRAPKPVVVERDGIKVAIAIQVPPCRHACDGHDNPERRHGPGGSGLADALEVLAGGVGHLLASCGFLVRFLLVGLVLGVGRTALLAANVAGWLLANVARGTLLTLAHAGITHRRLSRRLSPWLAEDTTCPEHDAPALVAQVLETPRSMRPTPPPLPKHARVTWQSLADADTQPATRRLKP